MFCMKCGKQIEDNSKFCIYCGNKIPVDNMSNTKDSLKKTTGAVIDSAKVISNNLNEATNGQMEEYTEKVKETTQEFMADVKDKAKVIGNNLNEATNGQAGEYAEKVKETAQEFMADVKQVAKDKDTSNFFTKNKYRNLKIIAVLLIAIFLICGIFNSESSNFQDDLAKQLAVEKVKNALAAPDTAKFSHIEIFEKYKNNNINTYVICMTVRAKNKAGQSQKMNCALIVGIHDSVTKDKYNKENMTNNGTAVSDIMYYTDSEKEESLHKLKEWTSDYK